MRFILGTLALAALSACSPTVPDSGTGVGFNDYETYLREKAAREAALSGNALPPANAVSDERTNTIPSATGRPSPAPTSDLVAGAEAALRGSDPVTGEPVVLASPSNPAPETVQGATGISRENDFGAVGQERSIEDDKALIAQNRAQYKVIEPTALPVRPGSSGPNIVDYALANSHPVGTQVFSRSGFNSTSKYQRNCAKYASPDRAQEDFLAKGGPQRDKLGLDPDGDGYACAWDPRPFRKAVGG